MHVDKLPRFVKNWYMISAQTERINSVIATARDCARAREAVIRLIGHLNPPFWASHKLDLEGNVSVIMPPINVATSSSADAFVIVEIISNPAASVNVRICSWLLGGACHSYILHKIEETETYNTFLGSDINRRNHNIEAFSKPTIGKYHIE